MLPHWLSIQPLFVWIRICLLGTLIFVAVGTRLFSHITQFDKQPMTLVTYFPMLDEFLIVLPPVEQSSVFHLLLVRQMAMGDDICLQLFIILLPPCVVNDPHVMFLAIGCSIPKHADLLPNTPCLPIMIMHALLIILSQQQVFGTIIGEGAGRTELNNNRQSTFI